MGSFHVIGVCMYLHHQKIKNAIDCSVRILNDDSIYAGDEQKLPISVDAISDLLTKQTKKHIEIREVVFDAVHLKGRKETFDDGRVLIDIRSNLSASWKRFVAVKELMHLIVDCDEEDCTPYGDELLDELLLKGHIGILSTVPEKAQVQTELVAEVAAMLVLYPEQARLADRQAINEGTTTIAKLSLKYEIPEGVVHSILNPEFENLLKAALIDS